MKALDKLRKNYPEYSKVKSDKLLADMIYQKFYAKKLSRKEFDKKVFGDLSKIELPEKIDIKTPEKVQPQVDPLEIMGKVSEISETVMRGFRLTTTMVEAAISKIGNLQKSEISLPTPWDHLEIEVVEHDGNGRIKKITMRKVYK